jgi:prephenate dehydrogenase
MHSTVAADSVRLTVVGAGLLGGSLLAALQHRRRSTGGSYHLTAVDRPETLTALRLREWCDALHTPDDLVAACAQADLIVLCTALATMQEQITMLGAARDRLAAHAIVTDVGSTKRLICEQGFTAFPATGPAGPRFVGGHPMAGAERSGIEAADPMLFQSALWVLCPPADLDDARSVPLRRLISDVGARSLVVTAAEHDDAVARISHVPQLVASSLAAWTGADAAQADLSLALAAGGFRDMTRLALSPWSIWRDIVATNRAPIALGLRELSDRLVRLAGTVDASDGSASADDGASTFARGRAFRERFHMPRKGILSDLTEIIVRLDDRPGQLLAMLTPLADAGINVQDLEVLKVREGESGTILLGFDAAATADAAMALLAAQGFHSVRRQT